MSQTITTKRQVWARIALLLLCLAIVGVCARACIVRWQTSACAYREIFKSEAPDKSHNAVISEQSCDFGSVGGTYLIVSMRAASTQGKGIDIFATDTAFPALSWVDSQHLVILISEIGWIGTSRHEVDGVQIEYRLAERLSEEKIAQRTAERNEQTLAESRRHPSPAGEPNGTLTSLNFANKIEQENLGKFKSWARKNIPGAYAEFEKHRSK